jgi:uncharacterized protein YjdB
MTLCYIQNSYNIGVNMLKRIMLATLLLGVVACESPIEPSSTLVETQIVITPTAGQVEVGRTLSLSATVSDQLGAVMNSPVTWTSLTPAVATVSTAGVVTGVSRGQATIRAAAGSVQTTVIVFVIDPTVATISLTGAPTTTFFVGTTFQAIATPRDAANNALSAFAVTWSSSVPAVATVSSTGLVTALSAGTTNITASAGGKTATISVTVSLVPVNSVSLSLASPAQVGRDVTIASVLRSATGATLTATQRTFLWASTDTTVATVSSSGVVRGVSVGNATITAVVEGKVGILNVAVTEVVIDHIVLTPDSADVKVGATRQFVAQAFDADSVSLSTAALNGRVFTWVSSDNNKFVVSNSGLVTGVAVGNETVTATIGNKSGTSQVVIVP